uniref:glutathione transferase n=1 Tax=Nyssomyia neivai TaxID=330878 RepID=A0A1L8E529_9DIPT
MAPPKLYYIEVGPPSRAALLAFRNLNIDVEVVPVDILGGKHRSPEYLKVNPQHTVPALDDNGFYLADSRAISTYLVNSRAPGNSLYPTDPKVRALVDDRLFFDAANVFPRVKLISYAALVLNQNLVDAEKKEGLYEILDFMELYLEGRKYFAADFPTLADLSLLSNYSSLVHWGLNVSSYKNLQAWYKRCESLPGFVENEVGAKTYGMLMQQRLGKDFNWERK